MVTKEGKPIFIQVLSIAGIVLIINAAYLIYRSGGLPNGITGFSIRSNVIDSYTSLPVFGQVFFITEISLIFLIILMAVVRDMSINVKRAQVIEVHIKRNSDENKTDLDSLYEALKDNKELSISTISKAFNIDKDTTLEWARILESGELATIEYPGFSEPVVRYNEKEIKNVVIKKSDVTKDQSMIKKEIEKVITNKDDIGEKINDHGLHKHNKDKGLNDKNDKNDKHRNRHKNIEVIKR